MTSAKPTHDKVLDHTRLQLSALFDGELALDEARFLQRRLQHDDELSGCVSRWQLAGDVLRGQATAAAPAGFAGRVAAALAAEADARPRAHQGAGTRSRWGWGSGAALAASVAAVALFMARQAPEALPAGTTTPVEMASTAPATPAPLPDPVAPTTPQAPDTAGQLAAATVAVASVPRRTARRAASRGQAQRAATTRASRELEDANQPQRLVASAGSAMPGAAVASPATSAPASASPFTPEAAAPIVSRPWPRALLPNAGAAFNVGYGSLQPGLPSSQVTEHPFRPRPATLPQPQQPEDPIPSPR